jgi:superfamily II DNA or RNA helicase
MSKFSRIALTTHLYVPRAELPGREYDYLCSDLRVVPKYSEVEDAVLLYDNSKRDWFGVPLYYFHRGSFDYSDVRVDDLRANGRFTKWKFTAKYRSGQPEVIDKFRTLKDRGGTGFILEAPPAFGKTVCLIKMMEMIGKTALVVVPRSNLIKQWRERLTEHSTLREDDIGWAEGGRAVWEGKPVCIGLVHTLGLDRFGMEFKRSFGTVVFDEVDRSVPPQTFAPVVGLFPARYRIGATATLKRRDGMHVVFEKHVGQHLIRGEPGKRMLPKVLVVRFPYSSGHVYMGSAKMNRRGMLLSRLSRNGDRNAVLAKYIQLIRNSGRRILVLSDRSLQLRVLKSLLILDGVPEDEMGYYARRVAHPKRSPKDKQTYEQITDGERDRVASACNVILATYGMFAIGTDIDDLAALVYATPQSATEQSRGRIERQLEGKQTPVVVDLVDLNYKDAVGWFHSRRREYELLGLEVKYVTEGR